MKILLFTDNLGSGGAQRQLVGLAIMLKEKGYDVKVCTYYDFDFYKPYLDENNVPNEIIPIASNIKKRIWAVRNYFKSEKPDWVIAYQETPSLVACVIKFLGCNYKLLVSERNTTQELSMKNRIRFHLYRVAKAIVPNSYTQANYMLENYKWMKKKIHIITNFVDIDYFTYTKHKRRKVPEIMVAATIFSSKNTLGFIDAVAALKEKGYNFHISWYGKVDIYLDYFNQCQKKIEKLDVVDYITLKEKTHDIRNRYQEADYFCLPSFYEGTPNVICEAMSCGLPIVCSNVCDNSRYVVEGENGYLFNPKETETVVAAFEKLFALTDDEHYEYSFRSRKKAEEKLSKKTFLESYIKLIEQ